jgi:protein-disulfide isomerase
LDRVSTRSEQKAAARARREATLQAAHAREQRRRRLFTLGGVGVGALLLVVAAIALSSGNGSGTAKKLSAGSRPSQSAQVDSMFAGIPQQGQALGSAKAPVTLVEFADLKCPVCRAYTAQALPSLVSGYVRTGKLRIVMQPQTFVGSPPGDSEHAARFALAAGQQGKLWQFSELWYANQQDESTAYATDPYIRQIASGVSGFDFDKAMAQRNSAAVSQALQQSASLYGQEGFSGTPSFLLGRTGQAGKPLNVSSFDPPQFTGPIDQLLKG